MIHPDRTARRSKHLLEYVVLMTGRHFAVRVDASQ